jgi:peptidyl-tRNA hydrolase
VQTPALEDQSLQNVIRITYNNGSAPAIANSYSEVSTSDTQGEHVIVRIPDATAKEYNFVLSGTAQNGSFKIYGDVRKGLYLNGVKITNSSGPAINIQKSKRVDVHLVHGTENFLADGPSYATPPNGEDAKGTFFSEGKLLFSGSGSLEVRGKYKHAIVVDNDIEIGNGKIIVSEAASDGIHANDMIEVKGGVLKITSTGDAIQSEKLFSVKITGGKIAASTTGIKSHGISSLGTTEISGSAIVQISVSGNGSKGIKSDGYVDIKGGTISIKTSGDRDIGEEDESTAAGIKANADLYIEGGNLTIKSLGDKAKGINVAGNAIITAGSTNIEANDDGIKVHGNLSVTGGTVQVKSENKDGIDAANGEDGIEGGTVTIL